ncbi:MAG: hypothetical protein JSR46_08915 [Verrucomicrobia bacterium]|nr:hypothetical protein [Verrucomicrobiota bacterium]
MRASYPPLQKLVDIRQEAKKNLDEAHNELSQSTDATDIERLNRYIEGHGKLKYKIASLDVEQCMVDQLASKEKDDGKPEREAELREQSEQLRKERELLDFELSCRWNSLVITRNR